MRGTPFDTPDDIGRQCIGVRLNEEMHVIWLDSQLNNLPSLFLCCLLNNLLQTVSDFPSQYLAPSLRTEDNVREDMVNPMLFMNVFFLAHVDSIVDITSLSTIPPTPLSNKERRSHPRLERAGLSRAVLL